MANITLHITKRGFHGCGGAALCDMRQGNRNRSTVSREEFATLSEAVKCKRCVAKLKLESAKCK